MHITPSAVLRRMAGVATAALLLLSTTFILDNETSAVVAGRQVSNDRGHSGTAPGRPRQSTTTAASATSAPSNGPTTSIQNTSTSTQNTSTIPTTTGQATTTTVAPTTTAPPVTSTTGPKPSGGKFTILLSGSGPTNPDAMWNAPYFRNLPSGAGWTDGERDGYACAWMFLINDGRVVGRVTFLVVEPPAGEAAYARINDQSMTEKSRYYDGTVSTTGRNLPPCPGVDEEYQIVAGDERPTVRFVAGSVLESRDYKATVVFDDRVTFTQEAVIGVPFQDFDPRQGTFHTVYSRVTVAGRIDGRPAIIVWYDSLDPSVAVTSDLP